MINDDKNLIQFSSWVHIINILILFIAYGVLSEYRSYIAPIIGLWSIFLLLYRIFWQYLGFENKFKNKK